MSQFSEKTLENQRRIVSRATNRATELTIKDLTIQCNKICKEAIDNFYEDYSERGYKPHWNLYNCYKIFPKKDYIEIRLSGEYMDDIYKRNVDTDYIYNLTIKLGYHGGATSGSEYTMPNGDKVSCPHPHEGVPYWRKNAKNQPPYRYWGWEAEKKEIPPFEEIKTKIESIDVQELFIEKIIETYKKYGIS